MKLINPDIVPEYLLQNDENEINDNDNIENSNKKVKNEKNSNTDTKYQTKHKNIIFM